MKKIVIGSYPFFHMYTDYQSHDKDYIVFDDNPNQRSHFINIRLTKDKSDTYYFKDSPKEIFLQEELKHLDVVPMAVNKFLVPEVCKYKDITLEDLKQFEPVLDKLDDKHKYLKLIYQAYVDNKDFILTYKQRLQAYNEYKKYRPDIYKT